MSYSEHQTRHKRELQELYSEYKTQPVLFIGSGFSRRYIDTPNWKDLLIELEAKCPLIENSVEYYLQKSYELSAIAEEFSLKYHEWAWLKENKGALYPSYLYDSKYNQDIFIKYEVKRILESYFSESMDGWTDSQKKEIELLKKVQPHAIVTTNYDNLLEFLFPDYQLIIGEDILKPDTYSIGEIFKIHGSITEPETLVLTDSDYEFFNARTKYLSAKLLLFFIEHPVYFIGYSINDKNILNILSDIKEIMGYDEEYIENLYFVEWDPDISEKTYFSQTKQLSQADISVKHILADSYEWVYDAMENKSVIDNIHPQQLRRFLARTYKLVKSDIPMKKVDVNFKMLTNWEEGEETLEDIYSFIVSEDPSIAVERYKYSITEIARVLGYGHWYPVNQLLTKIKKEKNVAIKDSNNKYHIRIKTQRLYSEDMLELLNKVINNEDYEVNLN